MVKNKIDKILIILTKLSFVTCLKTLSIVVDKATIAKLCVDDYKRSTGSFIGEFAFIV